MIKVGKNESGEVAAISSPYVQRKYLIWLLVAASLLTMAVLVPTTSQRIQAQVTNYGYGNGNGGGTSATGKACSSLTASPTSGPVKTEVTVNGTGCTPNEAILIIFNSTPQIVGSTVVSPAGTFLSPVVFDVPKNAELGSHDITAENVDTRALRGTVKFTVTAGSTNAAAAGAAAPPGKLAATGMNALPFALIALTLFGLGLALFKATRTAPAEKP